MAFLSEKILTLSQACSGTTKILYGLSTNHKVLFALFKITLAIVQQNVIG